MSFVSRLFSTSSSTALAADLNNEQTRNRSDKTALPQMSGASHQPNGSILRQPSPPGDRKQQEQRRVSFSSAPVKVTMIPANPTRVSKTASRYGISQALPSPAQNPQNPQPQPALVSNNSWFRSLFTSSKSSATKSSSPSSVNNDILPANPSSSSQHEAFRPLNNSELLKSIPLELTQSFNGRQLRLAWSKQQAVDDHDEPEEALDAAENIDLISSQVKPETLNNSGTF